METDSSALLFLVLEPTALTSLPDVVVSVFALHSSGFFLHYTQSAVGFYTFVLLIPNN